MNYNKLLKDARKDARLTQEEAAVKIGCSVQSVQKWETQDVIPSDYYLKKIAEAFDMPLEAFCKEKVENKESDLPPYKLLPGYNEAIDDCELNQTEHDLLKKLLITNGKDGRYNIPDNKRYYWAKVADPFLRLQIQLHQGQPEILNLDPLKLDEKDFWLYGGANIIDNKIKELAMKLRILSIEDVVRYLRYAYPFSLKKLNPYIFTRFLDSLPIAEENEARYHLHYSIWECVDIVKELAKAGGSKEFLISHTMNGDLRHIPCKIAGIFPLNDTPIETKTLLGTKIIPRYYPDLEPQHKMGYFKVTHEMFQHSSDNIVHIHKLKLTDLGWELLEWNKRYTEWIKYLEKQDEINSWNIAKEEYQRIINEETNTPKDEITK